MSKSILQIIHSVSVQKTVPKNTKCSRNETILKIGHHIKAMPLFHFLGFWQSNALKSLQYLICFSNYLCCCCLFIRRPCTIH